MKKIHAYIASTIFVSTVGVLLLILALDVIAELVDQTDDLRGSYTMLNALWYTALLIPSTIAEYLPLACLVGCLVGLGLLASSSELVIIRAAGVSINTIVYSVMRPIVVLIIATALMAEYVSPYLEQYAESMRAMAQGHQRALEGERGAWNREGNEFMHFNAVLPNGKLFGITRYRFDDNRKLQSVSFVESAIFQGDHWFEQDGVVTEFHRERITKTYFDTRRWDTELSPKLLDVLVLAPDELPLRRLHSYSRYLEKQNIDSDDYRLAFWQRALQPLATLSLVMIAISFILGPLRQVTMGFRVFIGVVIGLVFQTTQKLLGPVSIIAGFAPVYAVLAPILTCFFVGWFLIKRAE